MASPTHAANPVAPAQPADPTKPDLVVPYKQVDDVALHLHVFGPEDRSDGASNESDHEADRRPMIVWFHGGGWRGGEPAQFYPQSLYFAARGVVCVSAEYRLGRRHGTTPFEAVRDAFDAMRFVREHASDWGGDPRRIAAGGGSAGGHLAAALATLTAQDLAGDPAQAREARPDLLILYNPVMDNGPQGGYGHGRFGQRWREASPAHNLHAQMPPTLIMVGDQDHLIPIESVNRWAARLDDLGVPHRVVVYPDAKHGFFNPGREDGRFYRQTLEAVEGFLVEYRWLPPNPPPPAAPGTPAIPATPGTPETDASATRPPAPGA